MFWPEFLILNYHLCFSLFRRFLLLIAIIQSYSLSHRSENNMCIYIYYYRIHLNHAYSLCQHKILANFASVFQYLPTCFLRVGRTFFFCLSNLQLIRINFPMTNRLLLLLLPISFPLREFFEDSIWIGFLFLYSLFSFSCKIHPHSPSNRIIYRKLLHHFCFHFW